MKIRPILITGSNGFVGQSLVRALNFQGYKVAQLTRSIPHSQPKGALQFTLDLLDRELVIKTFLEIQPSCVVHLAAIKNRDDLNLCLSGSYGANMAISENVIEASRLVTSLDKFIFLGSCDEYGNVDAPFIETGSERPEGAYGIYKLAITKSLLQLHSSSRFPATILRPTVIYGPNQGREMFLPSLVETLLSGNSFPMTKGEQRRDFIYIDDVISAIMGLLNSEFNGVVINIGSGQSLPIVEVAKLVAKTINPSALPLLQIGALNCRHGEIMNYSVDTTRAKKLLEWSPKIDLEEGLRRVIGSFNASAGL